ncbi:MAG: hypothetical protein IKY78_01565 [Clostridia bacterium]|nr:hypothetical protein [Clostridia bacterium]
MKRSLTLVLFIIAMVLVCVFSASAQQVYTNDELTFSVPDILKNDEAWAAENGYSYAFCDENQNIELYVSVNENDGYSYAGMDDATLANYASALEDDFAAEGYTVSSTDARVHRLANGFEGIEIAVDFVSGEKIVYCWFATDRMCYDFDFYTYGDTFEKYVDEVMKNVAIVPDEGQSGVIVPPVTEAVPPVTEDAPPVTEEVTNNSSDFIIGDEYIQVPTEAVTAPAYDTDDNGPEICTFKGLTIEVPAILKADPDDGTYKMWRTEDAKLFLEIYTRPNSDEEIAVNFKDEDFKMLFTDIKLKDSDIKELIETENVKINGFKGVKLVYTAVYNGREYEISRYFFATKDTIYEVLVTTGSDIYEGYVDSIINTVKIDGKAATNTGYYSYIGIVVALAVIRIISKIFKKKKTKKNAPATNNTPNYFDPRTDAYGAQYNNQNNGYVENNGYSPDYNYSNNLDTTLTNTSDFSKTEYRNATSGMDRNTSAYEEE